MKFSTLDRGDHFLQVPIETFDRHELLTAIDHYERMSASPYSSEWDKSEAAAQSKLLKDIFKDPLCEVV